MPPTSSLFSLVLALSIRPDQLMFDLTYARSELCKLTNIKVGLFFYVMIISFQTTTASCSCHGDTDDFSDWRKLSYWKWFHVLQWYLHSVSIVLIRRICKKKKEIHCMYTFQTFSQTKSLADAAASCRNLGSSLLVSKMSLKSSDILIFKIGFGLMPAALEQASHSSCLTITQRASNHWLRVLRSTCWYGYCDGDFPHIYFRVTTGGLFRARSFVRENYICQIGVLQ